MSLPVLKPITGAIFSNKDVRDYEAVCSAAVNFPKEFKLKMVRVKNQGLIASCVAHAISEVIELLLCQYIDSILKES